MSTTTILRISETFFSLQGESSFVGLPTFFIRLTGCPLRCVYCDTEYAFNGGELKTVDDLLQLTKDSGAQYVCVTGGEPLAQPECLSLLVALCDAGFVVSLETSGAMPVAEVDARVVKVIDIKTPASGEMARNNLDNLGCLQQQDQLKFVLCDEADYHWAKSKLLEWDLSNKVETILFSPAAESLPAPHLAEWILADRLPVRFQLQLHKIIWGNTTGV